MPVSIERFQRIAEEELAAIPERFRRRLENVEIVVEEEPDPALLAEMGLDPRHDTLFGLYQGTPLPHRTIGDIRPLPDRIVLYYRPLARACRNPVALRREIRRTLVHEIAHFFGFDEDEIAAEGY